MDNHCNLCDKSYKNKNSLGHHVRSVHRDAGAMCSLCGTNFKQRESLSRHIERVHNKYKPSVNEQPLQFDCTQCGKSYSTKGSLKKHMTCAHRGNFSCSVCDAIFTRRDSLNRHITRFHGNMKSFGGNFGSFIQEKSLKENWKRKSDCEKCGKSFSTTYLLKYHIHDKHVEPVQNNYDEFVEPDLPGLIENSDDDESDEEEKSEDVDESFTIPEFTDDDESDDEENIEDVAELIVNVKSENEQLTTAHKIVEEIVEKDKETSEDVAESFKIPELIVNVKSENNFFYNIIKEIVEKATLTVYDPTDVIPIGKHVRKPRAKREEDIVKNEKYVNTSANKVIVLAVVNDVKESDYNLRQIFEKNKINEMSDSLITGDLKVYNILLAMSNNSSTYPCGFCKSKRHEGVWEKNSELRTLEDNAKLGEKWKESGANLSKRKEFFNCIGTPIVWEDNGETTYVIDKFAIPTLHCTLGTCNRVY